MAELEPRDAEMDHLLRRSLEAPIPSLSLDFEQRLASEMSRRSQPLGRYGKRLLTGYALVSALASAVVMHGQGLDWTATCVAILVPMVLVVGLPALNRLAR